MKLSAVTRSYPAMIKYHTLFDHSTNPAKSGEINNKMVLFCHTSRYTGHTDFTRPRAGHKWTACHAKARYRCVPTAAPSTIAGGWRMPNGHSRQKKPPNSVQISGRAYKTRQTEH